MIIRCCDLLQFPFNAFALAPKQNAKLVACHGLTVAMWGLLVTSRQLLVLAPCQFAVNYLSHNAHRCGSLEMKGKCRVTRQQSFPVSFSRVVLVLTGTEISSAISLK